MTVALSFLVFVLLLSGCQSSTSIEQPVKKQAIKKNTETIESRARPIESTVKPIAKTTTHPVVSQLLTEAVFFRRQGDYSQAIVTAERALAIDTKEAKVYLELAKIRQAQGETEWAKQLLLKAKRFSRDKKTSKKINWQLNNL